ncbi:hypothetical protein TA3x_005157 [Tundrisphaera sp. TA3]|uniref:hypothetical protein n=1 Tax=Tundrisphaera sp. TA3 TaxID=3435775 RepID=UPI003EBCF8A3
MRFHSIPIAGLLALAALAPGCSQETGPRTMRAWGDVTLDGAPVEAGSITFESTDDAAPAQGPIQGGKFDIAADAGPTAGRTYVIKINAAKKTGKTIPNIMGDGAPTMDILAETIPPAFNVKSIIKKTIDPDASKNEFHFKLTKAGTFE